MRSLIKLMASALMVCAATVASVTLGAVIVLFAATAPDAMPEPGLIMFGGVAAAAMSAVVGVCFCFVTLFFAAVTMPPTLWLTRLFDLPRPAMDVIGGGAVGLFCAMIGVEAFSQDKLSGLMTPQAGQILATIGLFAGCALGFTRHALLVRTPAPVFAADPQQGLAERA